MTRQWYIEHGFKISSYIEETEIARAERDVVAAYVLPIEGTATIPANVREEAIGNLAFLLILRRSTFATRAGAKTKTGYNSQDASDWDVLQECASVCHAQIENLRRYGSNPSADVLDICKIYFKTNFISI